MYIHIEQDHGYGLYHDGQAEEDDEVCRLLKYAGTGTARKNKPSSRSRLGRRCWRSHSTALTSYARSPRSVDGSALCGFSDGLLLAAMDTVHWITRGGLQERTGFQTNDLLALCPQNQYLHQLTRKSQLTRLGLADMYYMSWTSAFMSITDGPGLQTGPHGGRRAFFVDQRGPEKSVNSLPWRRLTLVLSVHKLLYSVPSPRHMGIEMSREDINSPRVIHT